MSHKFKVGDIIRVKDPKDKAYHMHNFYRITKLVSNGYHIMSLTRNEEYDIGALQKFFVVERKYEKYKSVKEFLEKAYRLITDVEYILYGK